MEKDPLRERVNLKFDREVEQTIHYKDFVVGTMRADFIVEEKEVVELKAVIDLEDVHLAQAKNYGVAYPLPLGLFINFGSNSSSIQINF